MSVSTSSESSRDEAVQYAHSMSQLVPPRMRPALPLMEGWRRLVVALSVSLLFTIPLAVGWHSGVVSLFERTIVLGLVALVAFTVFERWPKRLPRWLARWVLQVMGVGAVMPLTTYTLYSLTTKPGAPPFWENKDRMQGFLILTFLGLLVAPWSALVALLRQKEAFAREQALAFELERSELERQAIDARFHLLQAQVAPHFLFNTLANVQALVDAGSPRASDVLRSLTAYLRAAVPLLREPAATLSRELQLAKSYLELMHLRMPDRLHFALDVDESALTLSCPPTALLTLVENAVRHGIDPSEEGGAIEIEIKRRGDRCVIRVSDSGVGLGQSNRGLGTGLSTLRERMELMFGQEAHLRISAREPRGVTAELDLPVGAERR